MQNKPIIFIIAVIFFSVIIGCSSIKDITKIVDKNSKPKTVVSTDNKVELTVPASWSIQTNLNEQANLQVGQPLQELYTIIIPDSKANIDQSVDLEFLADSIRKNTEQSLTNGTTTDLVSLKIDGFEAKQFEASGGYQKINAKYIFTIINTPDTYYQMMSWTLADRFETNKEILDQVIRSFKLKKATDKNPPPPKTK
jgi:hypothetical protein